MLVDLVASAGGGSNCSMVGLACDAATVVKYEDDQLYVVEPRPDGL